jgi:sialate O-acetylesterase
MKKSFALIFLILLTFISSASNANLAKWDKNKSKKAIKFNEQEFTPIVDGFVAQRSGIFNSDLSYAELKKMTGYSREVYLSFDFSNITINAKTAKLRFFCESFDKYSEPNIAVFCLQGNQTTGLTWATRPVLPASTATISINSLEFSNAWLEWDFTPYLSSLSTSQNKQDTFVIVITSASAGNDALLKLSMSESATNKPSILLTDEDPINGGSNSTIKMPTIFSDNMVLQRGKPIKVWGEVLPNEPVTITFDGQTYNTQCAANGKFATIIPAKSASSNAYTLTVAANNETLSYKNIVMGDVFLCGGQSNMAFLTGSAKADQVNNAKADSNYPDLRFFEVAKIVSGGVLINANDKPWKSAIPERIISWSAVAFFVGRDLHKHLNIPIGLINVSHGGAPTDAFISPDAYASDQLLNAAKRPDGTGIYQYYTTPSSLYNSMIYKVAGYPIKAVLWYQAEANAGYWQNYKTIFKGLIKNWRTKWNEPTLPWLFVQLPAFETSTDWAETRDIQLQVWKEDPNTGMAVTMDCGEANNIHPTDKYTVAKRLLPLVRNVVYGEQIISKSPIYKSHEVVGSDIFVTFDNLGGGLNAVKEITEFEIAAADKVYKTATATILPDNRIKISNVTVTAPVNIRYAFKNFSTISIFTTDELPLPLSPFRVETSSVIPTTDISEITFDKINNAYASSTYADRLPLYAINGAGLIGDGHDASAVNGKSWHTNDIPFPHYFKIELKIPQDIAAMRIWNLNWLAAYLIRGVKDIEIYVSESTAAMQDGPYTNSAWKKVMNFTMSKASGANDYKGELLTFPDIQKNVKWIGINILNSYNSANGFMGISEIKLYNPTTDTQLFPIFNQKTTNNSVASKLVVYPNPTTGIMNIEKVNDPQKIEVFDFTGSTLYQDSFTNKIDLSFLPKGMYLVRTDLNQIAKVAINQ